MSSKSTTKAQWDDTRDLFLLQHLLQATRMGEKSDSGFKKDVWTEGATNISTKFGVSFQVSQLQGQAQTVILLYSS